MGSMMMPPATQAPARLRPADGALLMEVADTTDPDDAGTYLRQYARGGIPQYWIVNICGRTIEVYTSPEAAAGEYRGRTEFGLDATVPLVLSTSGDDGGAWRWCSQGSLGSTFSVNLGTRVEP